LISAIHFLLSFHIKWGAGRSPRRAPALMAWRQDAPLSAAGISKAAGQDVRTLPYLHWWTFIAYFMNIGSGPLATVVGIRHKLAKGQKLEKWEQQFYRENKEIVDLRPQLTKEEEAEKQRLLALLGEA